MNVRPENPEGDFEVLFRHGWSEKDEDGYRHFVVVNPLSWLPGCKGFASGGHISKVLHHPNEPEHQVIDVEIVTR